MGIRIKIVERVGEKRWEINGVGGGKLERGVKVVVDERGFEEWVRMVEGGMELKRGDIVWEGSELVLVNLSEVGVGIEEIKMNRL